MGIETISAYVVGLLIVIAAIGIAKKSSKKFSAILINSIFGGAMFVIFNILGMQLPVNILTIAMIGLLGVPGVILIIIMKFILGV